MQTCTHINIFILAAYKATIYTILYCI